MARYTTTVNSPHPPERVFEYVADLRHLEDWDPGVSSSTMAAGSEPGVGARYHVDVTGFTLEYSTETYDEGVFGAAITQPASTTVRAQNWLLRSVDTITVSPTLSGSAVIYDAELTLNGPLTFLDPLLGAAFNRIGDKASDGLNRVLTAGSLPATTGSSR